ncbi:MAG: DUF401 family protein [Peptococcaceae bacterium]|nr:DUF401 family protein [Peptococcaceae bacterium]
MMVLLGIAVAFGAMVLLIKKQVPLGVCLLAGGTVVGLFGFRSWQQWAETAQFAFFSASTLELAAIILLINAIGCGMGASGSLERINQSLGAVFPDKRYSLAFYPAVIGMLNVPGGAILSAPLVKSAGDGIGLGADQKAAVNLLFRHFWFLVYPFYTSMIVITGIAGVDMLSIIKLGIPATLAGFAACWHFCFRGTQGVTGEVKGGPKAGNLYRLAVNLSPVIVALAAALLADIGFIPALVLGMIWSGIINRVPARQGESRFRYLGRRLRNFWAEVLAPSARWQLVIIPVGINFFRSSISGSGAAELLAGRMLNFDLPVEVLIFFVPVLISFITGLHLAAVTISVPIFIPLLGGQSLTGPMFLLLTAASVGYWMSPLHLCLILTREYMRASYGGTVRIMFWPACVIALAGAVTYLLAC